MTRETLVQLGSEIGLDRQEITSILNNGDFSALRQSERAYAESLGIRGTPYFVINNKLGISGVKTKEGFFDDFKPGVG